MDESTLKISGLLSTNKADDVCMTVAYHGTGVKKKEDLFVTESSKVVIREHHGYVNKNLSSIIY
jgi:hypothetical protein